VRPKHPALARVTPRRSASTVNSVVRRAAASARSTRAARAAAPESAVVLAVVVPVFRHSVFVADAVSSACEQQIAQDYRVVIVDDGCPHAETRRVATTLAAAYPHRVVYLRRPNGGLSAARNTGVDYALARWPSLQAVYFLDADNFIEPQTLARAYAALAAAGPEVGWIYPDVAMFGSSGDLWDYSGPYSTLRHLTHNISEAGSMVRREVFASGCRFDETMRLGYEDWEFWWQAIEAGFVGRHLPFFGLRYRDRPESMLSETEREHGSVRSYMERKHRRLFSPKMLLSLEAQEAPRYALLLGGGILRVCTDPRAGTPADMNEIIRRYVATRQNAYFHAVPRFIVAASSAVMEALEALRLDRFALWWLQQQVAGKAGINFAAIEIAAGSDRHGVGLRVMEPGYWPIDAGGVHLVMANPAVLETALDDVGTEWIHSLAFREPAPKIAVLRIEVSAALVAELDYPTAIFQYLDFFQRLRLACRAVPRRFPHVKPRHFPTNIEIGGNPERLLQCGPLLPLGRGDGRDVCLVLPIVAFGGVEKVALAMARQFARSGWRCHLLVLGKEAALDEDWLAAFDSIAFYHDERMYDWSGASQYLGSSYPSWVADGDSGAIEGLLLPMDAVVNLHSAALHKSLATLRRAGVVTAASLHIRDRSRVDRETGIPFLSLGYEHAYDVFATASRELLEWCHALGVPADKLVLVPNAPGYELTQEELAGALLRRAARLEDRDSGAQSQRLHVLFLGRFDRQKGLDRLIATIELCRRGDLPIDWRIVGGKVIEEADVAGYEAIVPLAEPAIHDPAALTAAYEWADVLLLPSHWEGLPLTLLEAARLGVVAVAARVGAVDEAVVDEETGLLIDDLPCEAFAAAATQALRRLGEEPGLLRRLATQAARAMTRNWEEACDEFIARLGAVIEEKRKPAIAGSVTAAQTAPAAADDGIRA
jgi:glycosyltransferase involved in cell wall biosynthesis